MSVEQVGQSKAVMSKAAAGKAAASKTAQKVAAKAVRTAQAGQSLTPPPCEGCEYQFLCSVKNKELSCKAFRIYEEVNNGHRRRLNPTEADKRTSLAPLADGHCHCCNKPVHIGFSFCSKVCHFDWWKRNPYLSYIVLPKDRKRGYVTEV